MSSSHTPGAPQVYGLMAEFPTPTAVVEAAHRVHAAGYTKVEAYTPHPIEALAEALDQHHSKVPLIVLTGGILGMIGGMALQVWASTIAYPMNIGGRPYLSLPAFIVPTFETTILGAALSAVFGMLALNGLPQPYHPVFNVPRFALASRDRYFIVIEARDKQFDLAATRQFLTDLNPSEVSEVEP